MYKKVLDTYSVQGVESALALLMQCTRDKYGGGHVTILIQDRILSTIKNQDDIEEVRANFWRWKKGEIPSVQNRIVGLRTSYYSLQGDYHGGKVVSAVLITELSSEGISSDIISLYSMLTILMLRSKKEVACDGTTLLPCVDSLIYKLKDSDATCCVALLQFPEIQEITLNHGWLSGCDKARYCASLLNDYNAYYVTRDVLAIYIGADITVAYGMIEDIYKKMEGQVNVLISECLSPSEWDLLGRMLELLNEVRGVSILKNKMKAPEKGQSAQMNLFDLLGIEEPVEECELQNVIAQNAAPQEISVHNSEYEKLDGECRMFNLYNRADEECEMSMTDVALLFEEDKNEGEEV